MNKFSFKITEDKKFFAGIIIAMSVIFFITLMSNSGFSSIRIANERVDHSQNIKNHLNLLLSSVLDVETGVRGYLISRNEDYLAPMIIAKANLPAAIQKLSIMMNDNIEQQVRLDTLNQMILDRVEQAELLRSVISSEGINAGIDLFRTNKGKILTDQIRDMVVRLSEAENLELKVALDLEIQNSEKARKIVIFNLFIQMIFLLILIFVGRRNINQKKNALKEIHKHNEELEIRVTERTMSLTKSEEKFRSIMENSADAIFLADHQGRYTYTNKAVTDMLGFSAEEMKNKTILDLTPPGRTNEYLQTFAQLITKGKLVTEFDLRKKDGDNISVDLNAVLLPEGTAYASCRDITVRKHEQLELMKYRDHLEELVTERTTELHKAKGEAEDANKAKSEFLANMSHEIRTPMNAVLGYTELLGNSLVDPTQKDYVNSIKSSGRSLLTLINDILDLSKIEAGKLELEYDFIDTYSFFSEFENIFSLKVSEKSLKFILDISSGTPRGIYIDEARVRQIIFNLIGNAIKFTSEGDILLKVYTQNPKLVSYSDGKSEELIDLIIEVKDSGIGISVELQEAIFEPFVQEREFRHFGGTGLGLAISRRLTSLMNGTLLVRSEPDKGSTFTIVIPEIAYKRDFSGTSIDIQIDPAEIIFEPAVILIVDDVEHNRSYLRDALKNTSLKIYEANDGITGYSIAKKIVPDLIISDIRMPKMDGFELLKKLKADKTLKHIPVIAYSASVLKTQKEKIHNSDFVGLLMKPVKVTELYLEMMNSLSYRSTKEDNKSNDPKSELVLIGETTDISGLINSLESDLYDTWKTFAVRQPIKKIREFGNDLVQLGIDHSSEVIIDYGSELINAAENYNIVVLLKLVGAYSEIIENLKDLPKN
jgi:PAS domain S-box-containing protein